MLNVVSDVPISAYGVVVSVFNGVINDFVVVPEVADVIIDNSATIEGDFRTSNIYITIPVTIISVKFIWRYDDMHHMHVTACQTNLFLFS